MGTIYVVENDASARTGLTRLLRVAGYHVLMFASPEEFLTSDIAETNACLLLDVQMPGGLGIDVLEELVKQHGDLPVIFLTAESTKAIQEKAHVLKAVGVFHKPVDGSALVDTIAWTLETQRRDHEQPP